MRRLLQTPLRWLGEWLPRIDTDRVVMRAAGGADFDFSLRHTRLISSWGLMTVCDLHCAQPGTDSAWVDYLDKLAQLASQVEQGSAPLSVYLKTDPAWLARFAAEVAPRLERPFVLLTGDSDHQVDDTQAKIVETIATLPNLVKWFAQNLRVAHPKIEALAIGLDYHTLWKKPSTWQGRHVLPLHQESELIETLQGAQAFQRREAKAYCNWHFHVDRGDRRDCLQQVHPQACHFEPQPVSRRMSWATQSRFAFVLSPEGNGMDCHRTWEAMALGGVPVLRRNPLAALLGDLPAVVVDDWREVTPDFLLRQAEALQRRRFDFSPLFLGAWRARVRGDQFHWPRMTLGEFHRFLGTGSLDAAMAA